MIFCGRPDIGERERRYVGQVLDSGQLTRGDMVWRFERSLSTALGAKVLCVSSGTAALHLALLGVGVQPGDEVIVPATTFVATANAVLYCGARPVVADVDPKTWCIDPGHARILVTRRTKAIVPVNLYGCPADIDSLAEIVEDRYRRQGQRIAIVEDSAESIGSSCSKSSAIHPASDAAAYSFYGSKTITCGEGGAVACRDPLVFHRIMRLHGQGMTDERYVHDVLGFNYRMTELQAAIGLAQLERLHEFSAKRYDVFKWYSARLADTADRFVVQETTNGCRHGRWAFAVFKQYGPGGAMDAKAVAQKLLDAGIETRPIFPPVSTFDHVCMKSHAVRPLIASNLHAHGLVLPTHTSLTEGDADHICHELRKAASCS